MKTTIILDSSRLLQNIRHRLLRRHRHVEIAVSRGRGVGENILVDQLDGVADFGRGLRRRDHQIVHRNLNRRRMRRDGHPEHQRCNNRENPSRHHKTPYFSSAATCSACCWWPWKILRPVCNRLFSSALLADGMSSVSSAPLTAL